jgi:hypothetical protein
VPDARRIYIEECQGRWAVVPPAGDADNHDADLSSADNVDGADPRRLGDLRIALRGTFGEKIALRLGPTPAVSGMENPTLPNTCRLRLAFSPPQPTGDGSVVTFLVTRGDAHFGPRLADLVLSVGSCGPGCPCTVIAVTDGILSCPASSPCLHRLLSAAHRTTIDLFLSPEYIPLGGAMAIGDAQQATVPVAFTAHDPLRLVGEGEWGFDGAPAP